MIQMKPNSKSKSSKVDRRGWSLLIMSIERHSFFRERTTRHLTTVYDMGYGSQKLAELFGLSAQLGTLTHCEPICGRRRSKNNRRHCNSTRCGSWMNRPRPPFNMYCQRTKSQVIPFGDGS